MESLKIKKKYCQNLPFFIMIGIGLALLFLPSCCRAQEQAAQHVYDHAGYFSEKKIKKLETLCLDFGEQADANIVLLIEDGIKNGGWKIFMEDFYDANDTALGDCALLLLDINEKGRRIEIQGYGEMEYIITDGRIETIIDEIFDDLKAGNYYQALSAFPPLVLQYNDMGYGEDARQHTMLDNWKNHPSFYLLCCIPAALILGGIVTGIMAAQSGGSVTTNFHSYMDENRRSLIGRYDRYTHTTTSKRRKPKQTSTHGSGGGVSSGGHSHSGGGRSF